MSLLHDRIALLTLVVLLVTVSAPYALAQAWAPAGTVFLGSFYNSQDTSVYLSAMRAGARGEWLRTLPFTSEPHSPALYYVLYILLGHLAPADLLSYHLARLLAVVVLGVALWRLIGTVLSDPLERRIAFILALLGMGWGWLVTLSGLGGLIRPTDLFAPTSTLLGASIVNVHWPLAIALQFIILTQYLRARRQPYAAGTLTAGALACLVMGWVLPYQLVVVAAIIGADALWALLRARRILAPEPRHAFFILLPGVTAILYYESLTYLVPFWSQLIQQWPVLEHIFMPFDFAAGYGWQLVLAVVGALVLARQHVRNDGERLVLVWFAVNTCLIVAPLDFADRMSLGYTAVLGILSAIALTRALPAWNRAQRARRWISARYPNLRATFPLVLLLVVLPSLSLLALVLPLRALAEHDLPYYLSTDDQQALAWLSQHAQTRDIVLATPAIANLIPAYSDARVYAGHSDETFQPQRKVAEVDRFFDRNTSDTARSEFVQNVNVTALYASCDQFDGSRYLRLMFRANDVCVYRLAKNEY